MKTSKDFYALLNQSNELGDNRKYIQETTSMMESLLLTRKKPRNALVLGAGRMDDLSIDFFLREFDQVTFTDIDGSSMDKALKNYQNIDRVFKRELDYLGLDQHHFFEDFDVLFALEEDTNRIRYFVEKKLEKILHYKFSEKLDKTFDLVYLSPIYTQLLYRQVEQALQGMVLRGLKEETKEFVLRMFLQGMIQVIDHFNNQVVNLVSKDGLLFVASDVFLIGYDRFSKSVIEQIGSNEEMDKLYGEYQEAYGYGLGDYGLLSMEERIKPVRSRWFLWNQSKHQTYAVKFYAFEKIEDILGG